MRGGHNRRLTKEQREEVLRLYLENAAAGTALAISLGLTAAYAYRLANERGLIPVTRHIPKVALERAFA